MAHDLPMQSEHEAAGKEKRESSDTYQPDEKEQKIIDMVVREFSKNKVARAPYDHKYTTYYKFFRGVQWNDERPSFKHTEVFNFVFQVIQQQVPQMLDKRPRTVFIPKEPEDREFAKIMDDVYQSDFESQNWLMKTAEVLYDGKIYGTGYGHYYIEENADGEPQIRHCSEDPMHVYPSPDAKNIDEENEVLVIAKPMETSRAKNKWPSWKPFIKADMSDLSAGSKTDLGQIKFRSPTDTLPDAEGSGASMDAAQNKTLVVNCYMKPGELAEDKEETENGVEYVQRLKYPDGRHIVIVGENIPVESEESLPYGLTRFPYARYVNYILPREFFGISEIEQIESPQKIFNKVVSFMLDIMVLTGNPIWKVPMSSGVDPDELVNRPGLVVEYDGEEPKREAGIPITPDLFQIVDRAAVWFDRIAGQTDVTRGIPTQGVTAARAIEDLQEAGMLRIKQQVRQLDAYMTECGQIYLELALNTYSAPRVHRLTNKDGSYKYFKFHIENKDDGTGKLKKSAVYAEFDPAAEGQWKAPREVPIKGKLDVRVRSGSSLPFQKADDEQKAFALFDRGIIDESEVLERLEYPNREAVLERLKERQEAQAQQQPPAK